jgi:polar amino acid transport system permease protein
MGMQPSSAPASALPTPERPPARRKLLKSERRTLIIAIISTVVVIGVIVLAVVLAPGSKDVQKAFFSPRHLRGAAFGTQTAERSTPSVIAAFFSVTVRMFLLAEALVLVFALFLAVVRNLPGPVFFPFRLLTIAYIDFFRGIPLLLLMFIIAFGLPGMSLGFVSRQSQFTYGVVALTLVYSAYVAEVYRAGIESIHESQTAAARALGLSRWQGLRYVVLPQAIRRVIPPLLNDFIGLQKDTALVAAIGLVEVVRTAQAYGTTYFNFAGFTVAALLFIGFTIPLARFTDWLIARQARKMRAGGGLR